MVETKQYTLAQVKQHTSETDLWLVLHDKVYDVTKFIFEHPGGEEVLKEHAGQDATEVFESFHSDVAREQLPTYYIGDIVDADKKYKKSPAKNIFLGVSSAVAVGLGAFSLYQGYKWFKST